MKLRSHFIARNYFRECPKHQSPSPLSRATLHLPETVTTAYSNRRFPPPTSPLYRHPKGRHHSQSFPLLSPFKTHQSSRRTTACGRRKTLTKPRLQREFSRGWFAIFQPNWSTHLGDFHFCFELLMLVKNTEVIGTQEVRRKLNAPSLCFSSIFEVCWKVQVLCNFVKMINYSKIGVKLRSTQLSNVGCNWVYGLD